MTHVVTAPLVIALTSEGSQRHVYAGQPVPDGQSDEWLARHLDADMIAETDEPADAAEVAEGEGAAGGGKTSRRR